MEYSAGADSANHYTTLDAATRTNPNNTNAPFFGREVHRYAPHAVTTITNNWLRQESEQDQSQFVNHTDEVGRRATPMTIDDYRQGRGQAAIHRQFLSQIHWDSRPLSGASPYVNHAVGSGLGLPMENESTRTRTSSVGRDGRYTRPPIELNHPPIANAPAPGVNLDVMAEVRREADVKRAVMRAQKADKKRNRAGSVQKNSRFQHLEYRLAEQAQFRDANPPLATETVPGIDGDAPTFCCIVGTYGFGPENDCDAYIPCPYLALGARTPEHANPSDEFAICGGCNVVDAFTRRQLSKPCVEVPALVAGALNIVLWPLALLASHALGGRFIHVGKCCCLPCTGPGYDTQLWQDGESHGAAFCGFNCCGAAFWPWCNPCYGEGDVG